MTEQRTENETQADPTVKVARHLRGIEDMSALLLTQAVHKANDHEIPGGAAMVALGNVANLEAWANQVDTALRTAYELGDDLPEIDDTEDWEPPLQTLCFWSEQLRRDHGHEYDRRPTICSEAGYLRNMLTWLWENEPQWDDFAKDISRAHTRLENVLHDGHRSETGAPCPKCDRALVKHYGKTEAFDRWVCPDRECDTWYLNHEYRLRVSDDYRANADRLTAPDIEAQYEVPAGSVRGWATLRPGETTPRVRKRGKDQSGRQLYDVADVLKRKAEKDDEKGAA